MRYYWVSETCEGAKLISKVHRSWLQRVAASNTPSLLSSNLAHVLNAISSKGYFCWQRLLWWWGASFRANIINNQLYVCKGVNTCALVLDCVGGCLEARGVVKLSNSRRWIWAISALLTCERLLFPFFQAGQCRKNFNRRFLSHQAMHFRCIAGSWSACVLPVLWKPVINTPQQYMIHRYTQEKRSKYDKAIEVRSLAIGAQKIWTETMML